MKFRANSQFFTGVNSESISRALADCDVAISLSPGASYLRYNRAVLLIHLGRWEEAEADLRRYVLTYQNSNRIILFLGFVAFCIENLSIELTE